MYDINNMPARTRWAITKGLGRKLMGSNRIVIFHQKVCLAKKLFLS